MAETLELPLSDALNITKGTHDDLFLFVSEFMWRSLETGIMLESGKGIGAIPVLKTKTMQLFGAFFSAQKGAYIFEVSDFAVETQLAKILYLDKALTKNELTELLLMARLLKCIKLNNYDEMLSGIAVVGALADCFCSDETRLGVQRLAVQTEARINMYRKDDLK